ncbi:hypothetical protein LJC25_03240 [Bacteroidales bacterium OttesenSCG-928-K03]|nr:hypothetical protein [Odoribacter sp. OttesenSCG-928-L07]MDL2239382.1 hypothetical protein [Bacteroidales bacterium OttesenSCG-928-L14]MDL2242725.1 hypothetical protein [Bacteroidales bacterium OttesenSCG-928-K03]
MNTIMHKYSYCGYDCELINCDISSFCSIANNVIIGGAMYPLDWVSTSPVFYEGRDSVKKKFFQHKREVDKRTTIGHDVWIEQGIVLGNGSIIGAGSIVTKDVELYSIVGGNPANLLNIDLNRI